MGGVGWGEKYGETNLAPGDECHGNMGTSLQHLAGELMKAGCDKQRHELELEMEENEENEEKCRDA